MSLDADIACLGRLPLFESLPKPRLKLVLLMGERLHFDAGTRIASEGEHADSVYFLLEGEVEIGQDDQQARTRRIRLGSGSVIGDVPILCDRSFAAAVTAVTDVLLLRLPQDLFFELLETVPDFAMALTRDLALRLYKLGDFVLHRQVDPSDDMSALRHRAPA